MSENELTVQRLDSAHPPSMSDWRALLHLAKRNSSTLGFLPDSAFADRVRKGTLVLSRLQGRVVGYCLYDLPRAGHIKLVHVCADETARGLGAGKMMIDSVIAQHPLAIGVLAYCRDDYGMDRFWTSVGLAPRGEREGRAVGGSTLIRWWRPLGDLDLIEEATLSSGLPIVVYDTNIVSDLFASDPSTRLDHEASAGILAGWLQAAIIPAVSTRVDVELNLISDRDERRTQRSRSEGLLRLRTADDQTMLSKMLDAAGDDALEADRSLHTDFLHIADAIAAHANYFLTNDDNLLKVAEAVDTTPVEILRPHQLVAKMLTRLELPAFQSSLIESVDLEWTPAADHDLNALVSDFLVHERAEHANNLRRSLRAAISKSPQTTRVLISPDGRRWALLSEDRDGDLLHVNLFRTLRNEASGTVASQLARHLRVIARDSQLSHVSVTDPNISASSENALRADGFQSESDLRCVLIDRALSREQFAVEYPTTPTASASDVRSVEKNYWPLVLLQAELRTFVIPIQPRFAERLFAWDRGAMWGDRKRGLGLSREHVYYSGSASALPSKGSRILWYVTHDKTGTVRQILAYSRSLGCERDVPSAIHGRNSAVGVFRLRDVEDAADRQHGLVTVVRFEDTEFLKDPPGKSDLAAMFKTYNVKHPIPSFREVDPRLFDALIARDRQVVE